MAQRTDIFSLGRLGLSSGEGRRLDLHATLDPLELGGREYAARSGGRAGAARRLAHDRQRLRAAAALRRGARGRACAASSRRRRCSRSTRARSTSRARRRAALAVRRRRRRPRPARVGARRLRARRCPAQITCRPDCRGLCPRCGANLNDDPDHAHEAEPGPALGEAVRDPVRLAGRYPSRPPWPSPSRSSRMRAPSKRRAQHKISAPSLNSCPQCHAPRRPHRVCRNCGLLPRPRGRAVHAAHDHDHDH